MEEKRWSIACVYIKNHFIFKDNFINFSFKYEYSYDKKDGKLCRKIINSEFINDFQDYYGSNITNIIGLYGVNAIGKTTLVNLLMRKESVLNYNRISCVYHF